MGKKNSVLVSFLLYILHDNKSNSIRPPVRLRHNLNFEMMIPLTIRNNVVSVASELIFVKKVR